MIQDVKNKYLTKYQNLKKEGAKNRILLLLLALAGLFLAGIQLDARYQLFSVNDIFSTETIVSIFAGLAIVLVWIIFKNKALQFIPDKKLKGFGFHYKKDFIDLIQQEIPEIKEYVPYRKIHQKVFQQAQLFDKSYSDYMGDDWIKGEYHNAGFELCELHVFSLLKPVFHGFFIRCYFPGLQMNQYLTLSKDVPVNHLFAEFETTHQAKIQKSVNGRNLYIAIEFEKRFLTCETEEQIEAIEYDYYLLKDTIRLMKLLIDKVKVEETIVINL